jgi:hypothetical protein
VSRNPFVLKSLIKKRGVHHPFNNFQPHETEPNSFTMNHIPATPNKSTPLSSITETRCNFPNSANKGFRSAVASIDPILPRNSAIRGLTACCDTTVSPIISNTHSTTGPAIPATDRVRTNRATSNTMPATTPIMCIHQSECPTIAPAWSRLARTRNAPGATTKLKNTSAPSHKLKARNSTVRKKFDIVLSRCPLDRTIDHPADFPRQHALDQRKCAP